MLLAGMASGTSTIHQPNLGADCRSTLGALNALGCVTTLSSDDQTLTITSPGIDHWSPSCHSIDCGNSGTTARLLLGVLSACPGLKVILDGDESLRKRPMGRVTRELVQFSGVFRALDRERSGEPYLPIEVTGKRLQAATVETAIASAQIKSALMLAAVRTHGKTSITLPIGGRDHTERMLRALGVPLKVMENTGYETIEIEGPQTWSPIQWTIPGDPSAAAFWLVWSMLNGRAVTLPGLLLNPQRVHYLNVLRQMGADISITDDTMTPLGEKTGTISISTILHQFQGVTLDAVGVAKCIDEIPILAVAAAFAHGESRFVDCRELRVKESDRLAAIVALLHAAGAGAMIDGDDLIVTGGLKRPGPFAFTPHKDHRLVMAAAILGTRAAEPPLISDQAAASVSYPGFFDVLASLR